jgi:hypothetical protein
MADAGIHPVDTLEETLDDHVANVVDDIFIVALQSDEPIRAGRTSQIIMA